MSANGAPKFREDILQKISNAPGVSGGEEAIRSILAEYARENVDSLEVDPMGSLVARIDPAPARPRAGAKSGRGSRNGGRRGPHVMLCAHMDEVGLMVTAVEKEGSGFAGSGGSIRASSPARSSASAPKESAASWALFPRI